MAKKKRWNPETQGAEQATEAENGGEQTAAEPENFDAYHKELGRKALEELGQGSTPEQVRKAMKWAEQGGISRSDIAAFLKERYWIPAPVEEPEAIEESEE